MSKVLSFAEAAELVSLSRTSLWRLVRRGEFCRPVHLTARRRGFKEEDIKAWIEARQEAARKPSRP